MINKPESRSCTGQSTIHQPGSPISPGAATLFRCGLVLALALVLMGCSGAPIRISGQPPVIGLDGLAFDDQRMIMTIRLINNNDQPIALGRLGLSLALNDQAAIRSAPRTGRVTIDPRSRELLQFRFALRPELIEDLQALQNGARNNLPWQLDLLEMEGESERILTNQRGFLHAVPGQAGKFR